MHNETRGNAASHPVLIFKVLLLQKLYTLSYPTAYEGLLRMTRGRDTWVCCNLT